MVHIMIQEPSHGRPDLVYTIIHNIELHCPIYLAITLVYHMHDCSDYM